uniref:Basic leucine zipper transcriptional factor ATF-like n=1 Tax=Geotrypetes seraphini TaxID=260995 RepID=A0A6P8RMN8_GEOSA|nr:basic leucine zipper transcriptional factor ATF-like [Geotrypetes seraphini]
MHKRETDMSQDSDSNDQSYCSSPPLSNKQESSDDMKKVQRREKNRIAAQKSRQRQTQKADTLHLESENLERENASLRKEIKQLTEQLKYFSSLLSSHEPLCSGSVLPQPAEGVYTTFPIPPHICSSRFQH